MISLFIGILGIFTVMWASLQGDSTQYFQMHSVVMVLGGTVAILFFSTPMPVLKSLWKSLLAMASKEQEFTDMLSDLQHLSKNKNAPLDASHPLTQYAVTLWSQGTPPELFIPLLSQKRRELESRQMDATFALKNLTKYPPTLGMAGTVTGMIALFANLDTNKDKIGSSLSIAMTATFFGLILANMVISPLADRLQVRRVNNQRLLDHIYEILLLINRDEPAALINGEMKDRVA